MVQKVFELFFPFLKGLAASMKELRIPLMPFLMRLAFFSESLSNVFWWLEALPNCGSIFVGIPLLQLLETAVDLYRFHYLLDQWEDLSVMMCMIIFDTLMRDERPEVHLLFVVDVYEFLWLSFMHLWTTGLFRTTFSQMESKESMTFLVTWKRSMIYRLFSCVWLRYWCWRALCRRSPVRPVLYLT